MQDSALLAKAMDAAANAYCPYSKFSVGAAVLWEDGSVSLGVNVENASYPLGVCAERNAIAGGVVAGGKKITKVAVWAAVEGTVAPCGGCRQVIHEFSVNDSVPVIMGGNTDVATTAIGRLLPDAFTPSDLNK
jgi:cytidine deaminase|tara:strand:- start:169 stop:567 length:399 start_codon:yes stop_codon:yes gene_type:complete